MFKKEKVSKTVDTASASKERHIRVAMTILLMYNNCFGERTSEQSTKLIV
jgi:hypothetical protein